MSDIEEEPANLRLLRRLVTVLMVVMILGFLTIVGLLVMRFAWEEPGPAAFLPERLELPGDAKPLAVTRGPAWVAVVTTDGRILLFDESGALTREIEIDNP